MYLDRERVIDTLTNFREEWEEEINGESLIEVKASIGLVLEDVVCIIGLNPVEIEHVLGCPLTE